MSFKNTLKKIFSLQKSTNKNKSKIKINYLKKMQLKKFLSKIIQRRKKNKTFPQIKKKIFFKIHGKKFIRKTFLLNFLKIFFHTAFKKLTVLNILFTSFLTGVGLTSNGEKRITFFDSLLYSSHSIKKNNK